MGIKNNEWIKKQGIKGLKKKDINDGNWSINK